MTTLVLAESDNGSLNAATAHAVTAALAIGGDVHVLCVDSEVQAVAAQVSFQGVTKILCATLPDASQRVAENLAPFIAEQAKHYSHILAASTSFGKDLLPRLAALLDSAQLSDVVSVVDAETFVRPIYAGNVLATVKHTGERKLLTVRTTAFEAAIAGGNPAREDLGRVADTGLAKITHVEAVKSERPELTSAKRVVSGGRGLGSKDHFALIEQLADKLGAAVGASRAAVDAGYAPNDWQVGQTGKIVAPDLYIAVGVSGAIQHLAGMKDSKVIVAINKDENAPIFDVADYGLVADLFTAVPELMEKLSFS